MVAMHGVILLLLTKLTYSFGQSVSAFSTLPGDCTQYSIASGGTTLVIQFFGGIIDSTLTARFDILTRLKDGDSLSHVNSTECGHQNNKFRCTSPALTTTVGDVNQLRIRPCLTLPNVYDPLRPGEYCYTFSINDSFYGNISESSIIYVSDPTIKTVKMHSWRRLVIDGDRLDLWFKQSCNLDFKPVIDTMEAIYNINWGGKRCKVDWEQTNRTHLFCSTVEDPADDGVVVEIGELSIFNGAIYQENSQQSLVQQLLPLIIIAPVAAALSATATIIICLIIKKRKTDRQRKASAISGIEMVACPHVILRFEDLPDDLRAEVEPLRLSENHISLSREVIGSGYFGEVRKAILEKDGVTNLVAVKFFKSSGSINDLCDFLREAILMCSFNHKNVLECYGIFISSIENKFAIVVPYMEESDLRHYVINNKEEVGFADIVSFSLQIAEGMLYLANKGYVHRDLAARNCLIDSKRNVKVSDFGMSRTLQDEDDYYQVGDLASRPLPVRWMAPESLRTRKFTIKTDVWSFGVLVWELCTKGAFPFADLESYVVYQKVSEGYFLERTPDIPESLYEVMRRCWCFEPSERASFAELVLIFRQLKERVPNTGNYLEVTRDDDYMLPRVGAAGAGARGFSVGDDDLRVTTSGTNLIQDDDDDDEGEYVISNYGQIQRQESNYSDLQSSSDYYQPSRVGQYARMPTTPENPTTPPTTATTTIQQQANGQTPGNYYHTTSTYLTPHARNGNVMGVGGAEHSV